MELMKLLEIRRTYRRFDQSRLVPQNVIDDMLNALRLSSCGRNQQILRYVAVQSQDAVENMFPFTHWASALPPELGQPKEGEHPTLFIIVLFPEGKGTKLTDIDAGIAMANLTLVARYHGVGSCILQNIERQNIATVIDIPEGYEIHSAIGLGYPTHESHVVNIPADGAVKYYLDDNMDYNVPKRSVDELVTVI